MVDKTLKFVLGHSDFKTLAGSRTDSKVSANHMVFSFFVKQELDPRAFLDEFNRNLPQDIRALKIEAAEKGFDLINAPKSKEYLYLFSIGEKAHPFSASLLTSFPDELNLDLMKEGARLFQGTHDFRHYMARLSPTALTTREVASSEIVENSFYTASFFPEKTYALRVTGKGFGRYQIRMMMGQLVTLGRGEISLEDIRQSLTDEDYPALKLVAPGSGLVLNGILFG